MADYFVVGPTLTLEGEIPLGSLPRLPVCFARTRSRSEVFADIEGARVEIACAGSPLPSLSRIEAVRLLARLAERLSPPEFPLFVARPTASKGDEALLVDGFQRVADGWIRPRGRFLRQCRTASLEEVYRDPFTVPWNFVPREVECTEPILGMARNRRTPLTVLDVGFGFGKNATFLENRGCDVFGVEISATATKRTRELVCHPERFQNASAAAIPFRDGAFDAVLDVGCLHCTPTAERPAVVREIHRVLRPGGVISSRVFRPRDRAWVERQPFEARSFGLSEAAARAMFQPLFDVEFWRDDPDMIYLRGVRGIG